MKKIKQKKLKIQIDDRAKLVIFGIIIISLINIISSKSTYVSEDLEVIRCKGIKIAGHCLGKEQYITHPDALPTYFDENSN